MVIEAPGRPGRPAWLRRALFQIHLWTGLVTGVYILAICLSGSAIVFRRELDHVFCRRDGIVCEPAFVIWLTDFHGELLGGRTGLMWNGIGAMVLAIMCITGAVIWWPGKRGWWRRMSVRWDSRGNRFLQDLHNMLGFWALLLIFMWAVTGIYFAFPDLFLALEEWLQHGQEETPASLFVQGTVSSLTRLHFGRAWGVFVKSLWVVLGLVPCVLFITGAMTWWKRK